MPAPAKLNLFLHITGRRDDGYHLLQSVFMLIDWCDELSFDLRLDGQLSRRDAHNSGLPPHDLSLRAAEALKDATGTPLGAHITLAKHIPAEAGMGGGSSDAATTLLALNRLWGLDLPRDELARIGLTLGADVPFFIGGRNAWVEGIGEQLTPVSLPPARFVVIKPLGGASTQQIFASPDLTRDTKAATIQGFAANSTEIGTKLGKSESEGLTGGLVKPIHLDLQKVLQGGHNDLQPVAQALCPDIGFCLDWLSERGLQGRMTGSGTAVFAPLQQTLNDAGLPVNWTVRECSNMDAHPLTGWCRD
ncbi:MAG: 4-(cytidine 5'-diphospho)-2-C-methyl-D-erythritol kinase [Burkholderiaceae bacterium]